MKKFVIIVAGGKGKRMGSDIPKQFLLLNGLPVLMHTITAFYKYDKNAEIIIVIPEDQISMWKKLCISYKFIISHVIVRGGDVRFQSVKNALPFITGESLVAVHDGVRPLVSNSTISLCFDSAREKGNAIPVVPIFESIRKININDSEAVDRHNYYTVQTPQVFRHDILIKAYEQAYVAEFTDDSTVVEKSGVKINLIEGHRENFKITNKMDMILAEALLVQRVNYPPGSSDN